MIQRKLNVPFLIAAIICLLSSCTQKQKKTQNEAGEPVHSSVSDDTIPAPVKVQPILDSKDSSMVFFIDGSSVVRDTVTGIKVSGNVLFNINRKHPPIQLYTKLIQLTILETPATFRVDAYDNEEGQAIEVLKGVIRVAKTYASPFPEADTLHANDLYMINKSIDLSEKETLDDDKLQRWWEKYKAMGL